MPSTTERSREMTEAGPTAGNPGVFQKKHKKTCSNARLKCLHTTDRRTEQAVRKKEKKKSFYGAVFPSAFVKQKLSRYASPRTHAPTRKKSSELKSDTVNVDLI